MQKEDNCTAAMGCNGRKVRCRKLHRVTSADHGTNSKLELLEHALKMLERPIPVLDFTLWASSVE